MGPGLHPVYLLLLLKALAAADSQTTPEDSCRGGTAPFHPNGPRVHSPGEHVLPSSSRLIPVGQVQLKPLGFGDLRHRWLQPPFSTAHGVVTAEGEGAVNMAAREGMKRLRETPTAADGRLPGGLWRWKTWMSIRFSRFSWRVSRSSPVSRSALCILLVCQSVQ